MKMKKSRRKRSRKTPGAVTRVGDSALNAAEKVLSRSVNVGLDVLEEILKAVSPFSK